MGSVVWASVIYAKNNFETLFAYSATEWKFLLKIIFFDIVNAVGMTKANQVGNPAFVGLISYASIVYGLLSDIIFFGHEVSHLEFSAVLIILTTTIVTSYHKISLNEPQKPEEQEN